MVRNGIIVAAVLLATTPVSAQDLSIQADLAQRPAKLWQAVMTGVYGPYDKARKCWIGKKDAEKFCMRPHRLNKAKVGGSVMLFLAVGGAPVDGLGGHVTPGNLGLLVLAPKGGNLELIAQNDLYEEMGSWGAVPAEEGFKVLQIGPDNYGWVIVHRTGGHWRWRNDLWRGGWSRRIVGPGFYLPGQLRLCRRRLQEIHVRPDIRPCWNRCLF